MIGQDPGAGLELPQGRAVTMIVSTGAGSVMVPDVEGQPRGHGDRPLRAAGLDVDVVEQETDDRARTAACSTRRPSPATRIRAGDTVTIFVGVFVEPRSRTARRRPRPTPRRRERRSADEGRGDLRRALLRARDLAASGASVAAGLREAGHEVVEVLIEPRRALARRRRAEVELRADGGLLGADVAFPVLHGPFGEDGTRPGAARDASTSPTPARACWPPRSRWTS